MEEYTFPKKGIYRHFKGMRYELIDFARHSETEEWMVVYRKLYGDGSVWVRPLKMWSEIVERDGKRTPRFVPEEEWNAEPKPIETKEHGGEESAAIDKYDVLKRFYGYDAFRDGQEEVVDSILSGRDTLAVMPTGAGKSVCYQVPAMLMNGVTLVISPLISLMKDQVQSLAQSGIPAAYLNSSLTERQFELALANAVRGKYRMIYVAPERLLTPRFQSAAAQMGVSMVAVDEAHCISQWGQDFRPSYLTIPDFLNMLPVRPVVCAFTATATKRVREDIRELLKLQNPFERITGFDRKNLYYSVSDAPNKDAALLKLVKKYRGLSGIVYCATRKKVESVCELLLENGFSATRYHAGLSDAERQLNQEDFTYDRREIMVATNAFGMGIDKSNVRFIVHYNMPKDIESYYQEAGRAGRDGERSDCHLLFGRQDILTQQFFIEHMGEEAGVEGEALAAVQENARKRLDAMIRYCQTPDCLRKYILNYFGETGKDQCGFCVNCLTPPQREDVTAAALAVLRCVDQTHERFGRSMIIDILRGAQTDRILQFRLDQLLSYGMLCAVSKDRVAAILDRLLELGALDQEIVEGQNARYPILRLGAMAEEILSGAQPVEMLTRAEKRSKKKQPVEELPISVDRELLARLTALRKKLAYTHGVPPYIVLQDNALRGMADKKPSTLEEMGEISGIGVVKLRQYGKIFLQEIQKYRNETEIG